MTKAEKLELVRTYLATFPSASVRTIAHATDLSKSVVDRIVAELRQRPRYHAPPRELSVDEVLAWFQRRSLPEMRHIFESPRGEAVFAAYFSDMHTRALEDLLRRWGPRSARSDPATPPALVELGLAWPCTEQDVQIAVRRLRFERHPDRHGGSQAAHAAFIRLVGVEREALAYVRARAA